MTRFDFSKRGKSRIYLLTVVGTVFCVFATLLLDSISFSPLDWHSPVTPVSDVLIPLILSSPLFAFVLTKMRELEIAHHELIFVSATDGLTQVLNRRAFTAVVEGYLERIEGQNTQSEGALLVIDVDHFKSVNDKFGHQVGDEALKLIARTIQSAVRDKDVVGRIGGEEFAVFLPGVSFDMTYALSERIRKRMHEANFEPIGLAYPLTVSVGGTAFSRKTTFSELYRTADKRLYDAKHDGRDRVDILNLGIGVSETLVS